MEKQLIEAWYKIYKTVHPLALADKDAILFHLSLALQHLTEIERKLWLRSKGKK